MAFLQVGRSEVGTKELDTPYGTDKPTAHISTYQGACNSLEACCRGPNVQKQSSVLLLIEQVEDPYRTANIPQVVSTA
jgi:hypothetical protein